jgi:ADP-heptose:LPS heptosyltransferase
MLKAKGYEAVDCSLESGAIPSDLTSGAITYIHHSEAFIGGPSGLSWLAYYLNKKQVLISGVTMDGTEMQDSDNVRFIRPTDDYTGCKNCYHMCEPFPATNLCPFNKNYECNSTLTPERVFEAISELLGL